MTRKTQSLFSYSTSQMPAASPSSGLGLVADEESVLEYIRGQQRALRTLEIAKAVGCESSKSVNPVLYTLERAGAVKRVGLSPPMWILAEYAGSAGSVAVQPDEVPHPSNSDLTDKISNFMESQSTPMRTIEIAKAMGYETAKPVNPALYALQQRDILRRVKESPPKWIKVGQGQDASLSSSLALLASMRQSRKRRGNPIEKLGSNKNPIGTLHEYGQQIRHLPQFKEGSLPPGEHGFLQICTFSGQTYEGRASTKKEAKAKAAEMACFALNLLSAEEDLGGEDMAAARNPISLVYEYGAKHSVSVSCHEGQTTKGFRQILTIGDYEFNGVASSKKAAKTKAAEEACTALDLGFDEPPKKFMKFGGSGESAMTVPDVIDVMGRNPMTTLHEFAAQQKLSLEFNDRPSREGFVTEATIDGKKFVGAARRKQDSRFAAAEEACKHLLYCPTALPTTRSDQFAALIHCEFDRLQLLAKTTKSGRKVIAGFVMTTPNIPEGIVVAVGSGTQCASGQHLSLNGEAVNDCHAEIVARRSLKRFFYGEINRLFDSDETGIFERDADNKILLKADIEFHLYVSTAPCGDSALFGKGLDEAELPPEAHQLVIDNSKTQGLLRTKVEMGEGTIPIAADEPPLTWDGIVTGQRVRTMSCSDKVARWNVLGLQGSLLTRFVSRPIYVSSIVLGTLYHKEHLSRAVCCRAKNVAGLPVGYRVNHPLLAAVSGANSHERTQVKAANASLNWCLIDGDAVEIVQATTGRLVDESVSRISKSALYGSFVNLRRRATGTGKEAGKIYYEAKEKAIRYQEAKRALYQHMEAAGFGKWMRKPKEQESFSLDKESAA
eukprot:m.14735 g.14735  ORF g.14735 m.14735 type:complete len:837 (+) comp25956_c0_seq1:77-2587(+)